MMNTNSLKKNLRRNSHFHKPTKLSLLRIIILMVFTVLLHMQHLVISHCMTNHKLISSLVSLASITLPSCCFIGTLSCCVTSRKLTQTTRLSKKHQKGDFPFYLI